jgi:hypothetical protein
MKLKTIFIITLIILLLCGCGNQVQVVDMAGLPIKGATVTPVSLSINGAPTTTDASGFATLSSSIQEIKWIQVDCIGYKMIQVPVPTKYPLVITLQKP